MTETEFNQWSIYLQDEPLNVQEIQMAALLQMIAGYLGIAGEMSDFMVSHSASGEDEPAEKLSGIDLENFVKGMI